PGKRGQTREQQRAKREPAAEYGDRRGDNDSLFVLVRRSQSSSVLVVEHGLHYCLNACLSLSPFDQFDQQVECTEGEGGADKVGDHATERGSVTRSDGRQENAGRDDYAITGDAREGASSQDAD